MNWAWPSIWNQEKGGWWRGLITLALYIMGVVLGILVHTSISVNGLKEFMQDKPAHLQDLVALMATFVVTGLGLAGCLIGIRFVHCQPIARVFTDGRAFGFGLALQSAAVWALLWLGFTLPLPGAWENIHQRINEFSPGSWLLVFTGTGIAMTVGRTAEEVLFRGYLLTRVTAWLNRPWLAVVLVAVLFSTFHNGNLAARTAITLFGIAWGVACIRVSTLAPLVGAHVMHDMLNVLLLPRDLGKDANSSTTWLEVGLIAVALAVWLGWLNWATRGQGTATCQPMNISSQQP